MYNVYNKNDLFYLIDLYEGKKYLIGNKKDLIKFLADTYKTNLNNISKNEFFDNLNMGNDYTKHIIYNYSLGIEKIELYSKRFMFLDGNDRIIDVRFYKDEVKNYMLNYKKNYQGLSFIYENSWKFYINEERIKRRNKYKKHQGRKRHSLTTYKGSDFPKSKHIKKMDAKIKTDEDCKEYNIKPMETGNNKYPSWFDDKTRRVEGNWKSQYKKRHQYEIHQIQKYNWRNYKEEFFTFEEIDDMLLEDFNNKK